MTMKSKLTAIVISALTLTATASDHHDEKKGPKAKPAKAEGKRKLPPHMAKFDKNKDGKLCEAERKVAAAARQKMLLKKFDKDGDGKLNSEERKAAIEATEAMKAKAERRKNAKKSKGKGKLPKGAKGKKKPTPKK
jgi:hypothetical protein